MQDPHCRHPPVRPRSHGASHCPQARAGGGHLSRFIEHAATLGIDAQTVPCDLAAKGFTVPPRRRVVERTFGHLMHHRRPARDYEALPATSEAMIRLAMTGHHDPSPHRREHLEPA
ncbi:transposase [Thermomonospora curvata]|uniref:transposase n=1 Tax=Thermomonospora curvata TaxID=2020 RepID=UPI0002E2C5DF